MPIIYRRAVPESEPQPTDADDSIFLSDLVRTGEASRLRRRGALRVDHHSEDRRNQNNQSYVVVGTSNYDPEQDEQPQQQRAWRYSRQSRRNTEDDYRFTLFCGGVETEFHQEKTPFEPQVLPWPTVDTPRRRSSQHSNGCGALVHWRAAPHQKLGVWTAKTEGSDAVVPMDPMYFDRAAVAKIVRSSCGCVREGVGCAVCGNPLGTRYRPCKTAADGLFNSTRPKSSEPLHPDGPRYWHSCSQQPPSKNDPYIYTFFASSVTSSPSHIFHPRHASHTQPVQEFIPEDETPTATSTVFDRFVTASPQPLSDVGEDDLDQTFRLGRQSLYIQAPYSDPDNQTQSTLSLPRAPFDPDGDMDVEEPDSPDKFNEIFPER